MLKRTVSGIMLALLLTVCATFVVSSFPNICSVHGADVVCEIDLFSQRGGIGKNASSLPFETGERIILFAYVTYNQAPVQHVLVAFQVNNPEDSPILVSTAATNASGYATINFTIVREMYPSYPSLWKAYATSSPSQETVQDIMPFYILSSADPPIVVPDDYPTIQEAINHANEGDTVFVRNEIYHENVVVNKTVSLIGQSNNTVIDGKAGFSAVNITAPFVRISGFTIQDAFSGVYLLNTHDCIVENNIVRNLVGHDNTGVNVQSSFNCTISNNIIIDDFRGLECDSSENCTIANNRFEHISDYAIRLLDSEGCRISENNIAEPYLGLQLCRSMNNIVTENNITEATWVGIWVEWSSSVGNRIFHNNIVGNKQQALVSWTTGGTTSTWDNGYPSGGNYWSDYLGSDQNDDGIGDTPYLTDNVLDLFPLMNPYIAGDCDHSGLVNIADATLVGWYWLQAVPPAPKNADINDDGIINMTDAKIIETNWLKHA
jgi:parallel beta-helix repeat protein